MSAARSGSQYITQIIRQSLNINGAEPLVDSYHLRISEPFQSTADFYIPGLNDKKIAYLGSNDTNWVLKHLISNLDELNKQSHISLKALLAIPAYNILLLRSDQFERTLSYLISSKTNRWSIPDGDYEILITNVEFCESLTIRCRNYTRLIRNVYNIDYHNIVKYENLTGNTLTDLDMIDIPFDRQNNNINLLNVVQHSGNKRNRVKNYDELKELCINEMMLLMNDSHISEMYADNVNLYPTFDIELVEYSKGIKT